MLASKRGRKSFLIDFCGFKEEKFIFRYKNGTRASLTFSNQRMEEIQRENRHLLEKIMRNGPSGDGFSKKQGSRKVRVKQNLV